MSYVGLAGWRLLTWAPPGHSPSSDGLNDTADSRQSIALSDVLKWLPPTEHARVRGICQAQLAQLERYTNSLRGRPDEERARLAAHLRAPLLAELQRAFPEEAWHRDCGLAMAEIPRTATELLEQVDGINRSRAEHAFKTIENVYWHAVTVYRRLRRLSLYLVRRSED